MSKTLKEQTAHNIVWSFFDKFVQQGLTILVGIVLMRYFLSPSDYALFGMIAIIYALGSVLIDSGFCNALIRKQDAAQIDLSSVFYFNIAISILFYWLVFFCAPLLSLYFNQPILTKLARVMALYIPINALTLVQSALLTKSLKFKYFALTNLIAFSCSGFLSLFLAWKGFGVWVLVIQFLTFSMVRAICLWSINPWRPSAVYSKQSIKNLWSYSSKLLLSSVINVTFANIYAFFMGKIYPLKQFGFYQQANKYSELSFSTISSAIQNVVYPAMASIGASDSEGLKKIMRKTVRVSSFIIIPIMLGLIATAEPFVQTILSAKWLPIAPYMQIICVGSLFLGITAYYNNILYVKGLSSMVLKSIILYRLGQLLSIILTMHHGIIAMITGGSIVAILYAILLMIYVGGKINYTLLEQVKDMLPYFTLALLMGIGVFFLSFIIENSTVLFLTQLIAGASFYLGTTYLFGSKVFREVIEMVKSRIGKAE